MPRRTAAFSCPPAATRRLCSLLPLFLPILAGAGENTLSVGLDYARGDYGSAETTRTLSVPLAFKHESGAWTWRAGLPYVRAEGEFGRDQGSRSEPPRTEAGPGDLTLGASYALLSHPLGYGVDLGVKAKLATADKTKTLITTGKNDYSFQIDAFHQLRRIAPFVTLGYTVKGEPAGADYRNPFYLALGFAHGLGANRSAGAVFDYRQKVAETGSPVREVSVFYSVKPSPATKIQIYALRGFADGSPDLAAGLVTSRRF